MIRPRLEALGVPVVLSLASGAGNAAGGTGPAIAAALAPALRAIARGWGSSGRVRISGVGISGVGISGVGSVAIRNGDLSLASAPVRLNSKNHVVMVTQGHASLGPGVKEEAGVDSSAGPPVLSDGPVLLESSGAIDGRLIGAGALAKLICRSSMIHGAAGRALRARVVLAMGLNDIVFDKRVPRPSVNS